MANQLFSDELEAWLKSSGKKTLESLQAVFQERSIAIVILILMAVPALPIPTGGITHIFEVIVMLLSLEMIAGRKTMWLPKKWRQKELGKSVQKKFVPSFIKRVRWFEKFSRPRLASMIASRNFHRFAGFIFFVLALAAVLAPPFSGLDTLPALGAVIVALSVIFGDMALFLIGSLVGIFGISLVIVFGSVTINLFKHFF